MTQDWLADPANQAALYEICEQVMFTIGPEELPILPEIFDDYVAAAQQAEVTVTGNADEAFGLSGNSELMTLVILPLIVNLISGLLSASGVIAIRQLRAKWEQRQPPAGTVDEAVAADLEILLRKQGLSPRQSQALITAIVVAVTTQLGGLAADTDME